MYVSKKVETIQAIITPGKFLLVKSIVFVPVKLAQTIAAAEIGDTARPRPPDKLVRLPMLIGSMPKDAAWIVTDWLKAITTALLDPVMIENTRGPTEALILAMSGLEII